MAYETIESKTGSGNLGATPVAIVNEGAEYEIIEMIMPSGKIGATPVAVVSGSTGGGGTAGVTTVNTQAGDVVGTYKTVGNLQKQFDDIDTDVTANATNISTNTTNIGDLTTQVETNTTDIEDLTTQVGTIAPQLKAVSRFTHTPATPFAVTSNTDIIISNRILNPTFGFVEEKVGSDTTFSYAHPDHPTELGLNKPGWYHLNIACNLTGATLNDFNVSLKLYTLGLAYTTEIPFTLRNFTLNNDTTTQAGNDVSISAMFYYTGLGTIGQYIETDGIRAKMQISDACTVTNFIVEIGEV